MKKNTMMRIASVLMIAVLMTTCIISGTFAKYTNDTSVSDGARVAKWGWNGSNAITLDLFNDVAFAEDDSVKSADGKDVVAPGTAYTAALTFVPAAEFNPEVAYKVTYEVEAACDANLEERMTWTLKAPGAATATPYPSIAELEAAIEAITSSYGPNTALAQTFEIGWAWEFGADVAADTADTALGNAATLEDCSITIKLVVTQLDAYTAAP